MRGTQRLLLKFLGSSEVILERLERLETLILSVGNGSGRAGQPFPLSHYLSDQQFASCVEVDVM